MEDTALYRAFFAESLSVMLIVEPETGQIVDANGAACRFYGYQLDQLKAMRISDINCLDATLVGEEMERARSRQSNHFLFRHRLASGEMRDVDVYSSPIAAGGRRLLASVIHDVTNHRRTQQALEQAAARLHSVMATTMDGVWILDLEGHLIDVNERYAALSGYTRDELLRMRVEDLEANESREAILNHVAIVQELGYCRFESRHRTKDNRLLDMEISAMHVRTGACIVAFLRDITARKQDDRRLADTLELNEKIISASPVAMLAFRASGDCILANPAAEAMVGAPAEVLAAQNFRELESWKTSGLLDQALAVLSTGKAQTSEVHIRTMFGQERWVQATIARFTNRGEPHLLIIWLDIGEHKNLLAAEQEHARAAEELAQVRNEFVGTVSHELRSPLTAIIGYGELLEARWDQISEADRRDRVRRMVFSANRQLQLVEDLLLLNRLEYGAMRLNSVTVDVPTLIRRAVDEVQVNYRSQPFSLAGPAQLGVCTDADRLVQILINLIDNAAKYSPEGSTVAVSWELSTLPPPAGSGSAGQNVVIRVQDHGPGLPSDGRERLFQRFGRLEGSQTRRGRAGTGLGLYLSRQLAQAMGAELTLETTSGEGSVFRLSLPAMRPHSPA